MIQGEFRECKLTFAALREYKLTSSTYRYSTNIHSNIYPHRRWARYCVSTTSFTSYIMLTSSAQNAGWPAMVISDTLTVHNYYGTGAFTEPHRTLALEGVTIQAPAGGGNQDVLIDQVRQRTGMNAQYASMCLAQNGWDLETAVRNFEEIKGSIPAEAYQ